MQQARVFDRDDGLGRKTLDQRDLLLGKRPHLLAIDSDDADNLFFLQHRHGNKGAGFRDFDCRRTRLHALSWHTTYVIDLNDLTGGGGPAQGAIRRRQYEGLAEKKVTILLRCPVYRNDAKFVALADPKIAELGLANSHGVLQHGVEHRMQLAGRTGNHLQDFRRRGLLLQRLAQFVGAVFDFLLEVGVGFLKLPRHVVELVGQRLDFVAGLDADALAEVARTNPRRARAQRLDRHHHLSCQEHAGDEGEQKRAKQHIAGALDRCVKRRIGFGHRRLDKNQPAERRDLRIGGQHPVAGDILGFLHRFARTGRTGAADLRQLRHVGIAQHQADVGMRDQAAVGIDYKGTAALADLDLRHHVPDQLEIDLGDAHPGIAPRAGEGERHIGLGLAAEIDRPVIDFVRHGLGEFRLGRIVDAAADHVHGEPRDAQLLVAGGVDLGELGDGRHLPQQSQRVEATLIKRGIRPRQLCRPADLAVDLGDELLDFRSGALGLLALDADQRGLVLLV